MRAGTLQLILVHLAVYGEYLEPLTPVKKQVLMHRYKILCQLDDISFTELVMDVYDRQQKREKDELFRLSQVVDIFQANKCQARVLSEHFGDSVGEDWTCGDCEYCVSKNPGKMLPRTRTAKTTNGISIVLDAFFKSDLPSLLVADEYRCAARFLLGISSPQVTKLKLKSHALLGSLEGFDFNEVLEEIMKRVKQNGKRGASPEPNLARKR
jgi:ATP-dependent DNA helicase RecQ